MMSENIIIRGRSETREVQQAPVKPTIMIGIGGSGGDVLLRVRKRFFEKYGSLSHFPIVSYLWLDTDATEKEVGAGVFTEDIAFENTEKIMTTMPDTTVVTNDLNNHPHIKEWFYPGLTKLQTMTEGAGQIRAYSRLGFYQHYTKIRSALGNAKAQVHDVENIRTVQNRHNLEINPSDLQVIFVFSIAGGTGSGMYLDLAFLVKEMFRGLSLTTIGIVLMPGLFNPNEDRVFANGYAALKELEYYSYEHKYKCEWPDMVPREIEGPPFNYTYLIDNSNLARESVNFGNREIVFNMVAENIFKDFTQGDFAGYKRGVRVNLDQYMVDLFAFRHLNENRDSIIDQRFITRYGSFGMASITVPADRIEQACAYRLAADVVDHWGSLSNSGYHAASLTEEVLQRLMPRIGIYEGNLSAEGRIEQRHDIQNALLDDGRKQNHKMHQMISQAVSGACREVGEGVHKQRGQTIAQYLRNAADKELGKLRRDNAEPQRWGDYARAIHFNKEELFETTKQRLRAEMGALINEQHQSVGYAVALLRQLVNVLRDENREYIPTLTRAAEQAGKRADEKKRELDALLAELMQHESGFNLRKKTIIGFDIERFESIAADYLRALLQAQVRNAAVEFCERLIQHIGAAGKTEEGGELVEGLIGELHTLGGQLEQLKEGLLLKYNHFRQPSRSDLSLQLYEASDIENIYLPRYLGTGENARRQKESIGDQILQELRTSVIELPRLVKLRGRESVEQQIRDLARRPFRNLRRDFDVIEALWKKLPNEADREKKVRDIYRAAKFWLNGGGRARSYELQNERHKIIVGVPQESADEVKLQEFKMMLTRSIQNPGDPAVSLQNISERSEIVFYSEVGGIPINWSNAVPEMRQKYLAKQSEGEELHTDCNEVKFDDLVVLNEREREELEQAHECFLLGMIFGKIWPEQDKTGRIRYIWKEMIGIRERQVALGIEPRALADLISKPKTREAILKAANEELDQVYRNRDMLARFYALLAWYADEIYPEKRVEGSDGSEHLEKSNMLRAAEKHINAVTQYIESQERTQRDSMREFRALSISYRNNLDPIAPRLVDGKRALRLDAPGETAAPGEQKMPEAEAPGGTDASGFNSPPAPIN